MTYALLQKFLMTVNLINPPFQFEEIELQDREKKEIVPLEISSTSKVITLHSSKKNKPNLKKILNTVKAKYEDAKNKISIEQIALGKKKENNIEMPYDEIAAVCKAILAKTISYDGKNNSLKYKKLETPINAKKGEIYNEMNFGDFCTIVRSIIQSLKKVPNVNTLDLQNQYYEKIICGFNNLITHDDLNMSNRSIQIEVHNFEEALQQHKVHCELVTQTSNIFDEKYAKCRELVMDPKLLNTYKYLSNELENYRLLRSEIKKMSRSRKINRDEALNEMLEAIKKNRADFFAALETSSFSDFQEAMQKPITLHEFLRFNAN